MKIEIVSDHVCPWCYIGKRRLDTALEQRPDLPVEITWLPYQLSPDMPREGRDRREHYAQIFGAERAKTIMENMGRTAGAEGLRFHLKPGARSPNTLAAHALVHLAQQRSGIDTDELVERLFAAHHSECLDLGDTAVLARIAGECGLDPAATRESLEAREHEPAVLELIAQARQAGVTGVPFFIFDRRYALSGAQPPEAILQVLDELTEPQRA